ncbi:CLUMA_CG003164, isoform A [Clunio marinus]|uniref:CLUMA_CG003164, isoform A n=1 Tax=Clunio marinus TaxID=568069 RepID=A0A1J1HMY3_9DIPT|nr:CLUMA_CG003164, isoform A [Clunio marinus]
MPPTLCCFFQQATIKTQLEDGVRFPASATASLNEWKEKRKHSYKDSRCNSLRDTSRKRRYHIEILAKAYQQKVGRRERVANERRTRKEHN